MPVKVKMAPAKSKRMVSQPSYVNKGTRDCDGWDQLQYVLAYVHSWPFVKLTINQYCWQCRADNVMLIVLWCFFKISVAQRLHRRLPEVAMGVGPDRLCSELPGSSE